MPHSITNYQHGHYLVECQNCKCSWKLHARFVKLHRCKGASQYQSKEIEKCVACGAPEILVSEMSILKLWCKKNPVHQPYHTEISSPWGIISSIRFQYSNNIGARGSSMPYLTLIQGDRPITLRGELVTPKNIVVNLDSHCTFTESSYEVNPFYVVATTKGMVLYRLDNIRIVDTQPFVSVNLTNRVATLTSIINFSASLTYSDPILGQR